MTIPQHFEHLNQYYDKVYILTLPRLTDRMEHCKQILDGLNYEFFYGIDKSSTSIQEATQKGIYSKKAYQEFYKKPEEISLGMLCCALGHTKIYESIIKNGFQKTLILEDDAVLKISSLEYFPQMMRELPTNWELVYLGYEKHEVLDWKAKINQYFLTLFPHHTQLKLNRKIFSNYYPVNISTHIAKAGFHDCTHAYAVTLEAAKKMLQLQQPVKFHPDNLLSYMICNNKLNGYIVQPKLFDQLSAFAHKINSMTED